MWKLALSAELQGWIANVRFTYEKQTEHKMTADNGK